MDRNITLTDGTITLRPYQMSDVEALFEAASESITEVYPWIPFCHPDYAIEESRGYIETVPDKWEEGTAYDFAIIDSDSGAYLGGCGLNGIQPNIGMANLGYWVRTSRTKRGVATAATLLLARFAFDRVKLNRVEIVIDVNNTTSQRVAEKVGAAREGILRNRLTYDGKPSDAVMFSLVPQDLETK